MVCVLTPLLVGWLEICDCGISYSLVFFKKRKPTRNFKNKIKYNFLELIIILPDEGHKLDWAGSGHYDCVYLSTEYLPNQLFMSIIFFGLIFTLNKDILKDTSNKLLYLT